MSGQVDDRLQRGLGNLYATWLTVGVALFGQALWFSWQYGTLSEKVGEVERRATVIEAQGSPLAGTLKNQVDVDGRRLAEIERYVPDRLLALSISETSAETRLSNLEHAVNTLVPDRLLKIATDGATFEQRIAALEREIRLIDQRQQARLRDEKRVSNQ